MNSSLFTRNESEFKFVIYIFRFSIPIYLSNPENSLASDFAFTRWKRIIELSIRLNSATVISKGN